MISLKLFRNRYADRLHSLWNSSSQTTETMYQNRVAEWRSLEELINFTGTFTECYGILSTVYALPKGEMRVTSMVGKKNKRPKKRVTYHFIVSSNSYSYDSFTKQRCYYCTNKAIWKDASTRSIELYFHLFIFISSISILFRVQRLFYFIKNFFREFFNHVKYVNKNKKSY